MNDDVVAFLEAFFAAEVDALAAQNVPDIDDFNAKLERMNSFLVDQLHNKFGMIPQNAPRDAEYYERVKDWPPPGKRVLFRVDTHESPDGAPLYSCLVSNSNPRKAKVFERFIVKRTDGGLKIDATSHLTDRGMGGTPGWYFRGGDTRYERIGENEHGESQYLLDETSLGRKIATERLTEPVAKDTAGLVEYHRD